MENHVLRILNHKGDDETTWEADPATQEDAKREFLKLQRAGHAFFRIENGQSELIKNFTPEATEIIAVPQLVGG